MRKKRERSLVKVIFEYDNGEAEYLDGKNLGKWKRAANGTALMSWVHGGKTGFEGIRKPFSRPSVGIKNLVFSPCSKIRWKKVKK